MKNAVGIFIFFFVAYAVLLGDRLGWSAHNQPFGSHYAHLANSFLHGQLHHVGNQPLNIDDEAFYKGRWSISFPPVPAIMATPLIAVFGLKAQLGWLWLVIAACVPAWLWLSLEKLSALGLSYRTQNQNFWLSLVFGLGTVFCAVAAQNTVWFIGQTVTCFFVMLFIYFTLGLTHPGWAAVALGCAFMTRPPILFAGIFFLSEWWRHFGGVFEEGRYPRPRLVRAMVLFVFLMAVIGSIAMAYNVARFDNPFEFGHRYLRVPWQTRIQRWGLFDVHYLPRNLAIFLAGVPWFRAHPPYFVVSAQGLAWWVTSPFLFWLFRLDLHDYLTAKEEARRRHLLHGALAVMLLLLCTHLLYQNSGWSQFGFRFSLDAMPFIFVMLAMALPSVTRGFWLCCAIAMGVNLLGAFTFHRSAYNHLYDYDRDRVLPSDH